MRFSIATSYADMDEYVEAQYKILYLSQLIPYPPDAGPKVRAYYTLRRLSQRHAVTLLAFSRPDDKPESIEHLKELCSAVYTLPMQRSRLRDARSLALSLLRGRSFVIHRDYVPEMAKKLDYTIWIDKPLSSNTIDFMSSIRRLINRLGSISARSGDSLDLRSKKRILALSLSISIIPTTFFTFAMASSGATLAAATLVLMDVVAIGLLIGLALRPNKLSLYYQVLCLANICVSISITLLFGGILASGVNILWGLLSPLAALIGLNRRMGWLWMGVFCLGVVFLTWQPAQLPILYKYSPDQVEFFTAMNLLIVPLFFYGVLDYFIRQRDEFRRKTEELLRNILPDEIAERLKGDTSLIADHYDEASVLFADVVNFTPMSANMTPTELVSLLNDVFSAFDTLTKRFDLEKIKTIGDCYMVAAGVPKPRPDHAHALVELALEMQELVRNSEFGGRQLAFRIGINSGPLVAGVIGTQKFNYDLWGDAVNTASRMESHGQGGMIQITQQTYERIKDKFDCTSRGVINVKGKGDMAVWEVCGRI